MRKKKRFRQNSEEACPLAVSETLRTFTMSSKLSRVKGGKQHTMRHILKVFIAIKSGLLEFRQLNKN
jgi:hypothetical protein